MTNPGTLSGSVAVVTGGTRGIGRAIAATLLKLGATLVITGRVAEQVAATAHELAGDSGVCHGVVCDIQDLSSVEALGNYVRQTHGRVDVLVNNAGVGGPASLLHELHPEAWDTIFHTNVRGVFYAMRAMVPLMIATGGGHIVNISSLAGKNPLPRGAAYSSSKWALNGLSYSAAEELRAHNIRVSVVCPGSVDTDFSPHSDKSSEKMLIAEDVAHVVAMLVTQRAQSFASEILLRPTQKP
ncbi:MAG TPA: SDR family NAD(P)-dependent oxidoreductase [Candidatus Angelobacter sp.]|jgi:3-oxoacyl-[acyl-carrier protein] reductase|nr:SDR family NAD(P)-dependent oxidoreductase [Candidatus Angelobacter sp.]